MRSQIGSAYNDISIYFKENQITLNLDQIFELLLTLLQDNSKPIREFLNSTDSSNNLIKSFGDNGKILIDYLKIAEKQKPDEYQTIQDLIFGSIVGAAISLGTDNFLGITTKKFKRNMILLDTNFLISILELRPSTEVIEAAKELFYLLKKNNFSIRVFDFTVAEVTRVLSWYLTDDYRYPSTLMVDDVCSYFKRNGWTHSQLREYIANIETTLMSLGVEIIPKMEINLSNYTPKNDQLRNKLVIYKGEQSKFAQNHDLAAIECVREMRHRSVMQIEAASPIFLTSDAGLSRFDFEEFGHKDAQTIAEVILDRLLTNILWLKTPSAKPSLKSIIASHSHDLFVKTKVWSKFYDVLRELAQKGEIQEENISMLFYQGYIEDTLKHFDDNQSEDITREFVLEEIIKATKRYEEDVDIKLKEKESDYLRQLDLNINRIEKEKNQQKDREWNEIITKMKKSIEESSRKSANNWVIFLRIIIFLLLAVPIIYSVIINATSNNWQQITNISDIMSIG